MLNRGTFRIISLALILALLSVPAIYNADAQDPPRPPDPKRPPQQQDARERKGAQRQGAQVDDLGTPVEGRIKIETDLVNLDVTVEEKSLFRKSPAKKARELLSRIADDSGGRAYFPQGISEIPAIAAQISKDLRTQYVLSYYPANDKRDGTFRTIQVGVNQVGGRKLIARARRGYYARNAQGQLPAAPQKKFRGD
jgi:VWFA-related protein